LITPKSIAAKVAELASSAAKSGAAVRVKAALPGVTVTFPGVAGMALLALGAAWIYLPAGLLVGGLLLLRLDSRL
jgi:hypothetical protein